MTWPGLKLRPLDPEYSVLAFQPLYPPQQTLKPLPILNLRQITLTLYS